MSQNSSSVTSTIDGVQGWAPTQVAPAQSSYLLLSILLLALFLRLIVCLVDVVPTSDYEWYFTRAIEIANGNGYNLRGSYTAFWPVGWPGAMAALFTLTGSSLLAVQLANAIMGTACCWLTALLGERMTGSARVGRWAALLLAVYPNQIAYVPLPSTEIFYEFMLLASLALLIKATRSAPMWVLTGLLFGVATLTKAQTLILPALLFGWIWLVHPSKVALRTYAIRCVLVYVGLALAVTPWTYRNWTVFGSFVPVSTNGGWTLLTGNNPEANGTYVPNTSLARDIANDFEAAREVIRDKIAHDRAIEWIKHNPFQFLALLPKKMLKMWVDDGEAEWLYQRGFAGYDTHYVLFRSVRVVNQLYYVMLMVLAVPASFLLLRGKAGAVTPWAHVGLALIAYLSLVTMLFSGQSRFHFNLMPIIAIYAAWSVSLWLHSRARACPNT